MSETNPTPADHHIEAGCMAAWEVSRPFIAKHFNRGCDPGPWSDQEDYLKAISREEVRAAYEAIRAALAKSSQIKTGSRMGKVKLTKPQIEVLKALEIQPTHFSETYPPLKKMLERGYASERQGRLSSIYQITDLGRSALAEEGSGT